MDRQFSENLLLGQAKIYMENFQFRLFAGNNQNIFLTNHLLDIAEVEIALFDTTG